MGNGYEMPELSLVVRYSRCGITEGGLLRWQCYVYLCPDLESILASKLRENAAGLYGLNLERMAAYANCSKDSVRRDLRSVIESMRLLAHLVPTHSPQDQIRRILDETREAARREWAPE